VPSGLVLRFVPGDFLGSSWLDPRIGPRGSKFGGQGAGWVDYAVGLPDDFDPGAVRRLRLRFEAGSYGFLSTLEADEALTRRIVENVQGGRLIVRFEVPPAGLAGGLNLYGQRMGAYPVAPTIFLDR
jgi:hypothetical protein